MSHGFTVVELLTVVTILTILAALCFPVLGYIQRKGQSVTCTHQIRQSAQVVLLYAADHRRFPASNDASGSTPWCIQNELAPYGDSKREIARAAICPANLVKKPGAEWIPIRNYYDLNGYPYLVNYNVISPPSKPRVNLASIESPAQRVLLLDNQTGPIYGFGLYSTSTVNGWGRVAAPHFNLTNVAWCDGHVTLVNAAVAITNTELGYQ